MQALIFNSGLGVRMAELCEKKHKSMVTLYNGESIFERQVSILSNHGIKEFIVTTGPFKEQLEAIAKKKEYKSLKFIFVESPLYRETNYIYSMYLAIPYLKGDVLMLHGDLVFNTELVKEILADKRSSLGVVNKYKKQPEKDFKARVKNNQLYEVGVNIFDDDCYFFQPLYKLESKIIKKWCDKVTEFVNNGNVKVYAENALNKILPLGIEVFSSDGHYIEEIDTPEDTKRVSCEIQEFDKQVFISPNNLSKFLSSFKKTLIVTNEVFKPTIKGHTFFCDFTSNPTHEEVKNGVDALNQSGCDFIVSLGGGSAIDVAKGIKYYSGKNIQHLAMPTTAGTGSESTKFAVVYKDGEKMSLEAENLLPEFVCLDPKHLKTLPYYHKMSCMLDALCQAIESYWSVNASETSRGFSRKALSMILANIDGYMKNDETAIANMLIAANYAGRAINIAKTTAAHALSYKLTSLYGIAHGHAVALCLPHVWCDVVNDLITKEHFIKIFKSCKLPKPKLKASDIDVLVSSVNQDRLKNHPVELCKKDIENVYRSVIY